MLFKYFILAIRINWLFGKIRFLPAMPLIGRWYNTYKRQKNIFRLLQLKSRLQEGIMGAMFGKYLSGIVFDTYNGRFVNNVQDVQINNVLGFAGAYNKSELEFITSLVTGDSQVYVVGAHIGTLLVPVSKVAKQVIAFEANPATFRYLMHNIHLNERHNVLAFNYAIYHKETELPFYNSTANSGGSKLKPAKDSYSYHYDNPEVIQVPAKSLDRFVEEHQLPLPNLLIMDIEGAEFFALQGAGRCLANASYLYIEFVPQHLSDVANVSVEEFTTTITSHFGGMKIVQQVISQQGKEYRGQEIASILLHLYNSHQSADLLFYK
ncbi:MULTISPECIES: FkbM family methyltransferase [Niastella]|uniref:FkbM family methyltransferase n=1 Tax=Niastella soli TaxID=2821487 RepID=A0ABS3Z6W8_9BACT|nr:FkbM family methyltransferase [Niastella soli]MBO9205527.1 FkbM family methyltransferase [Niastella soli]